VEEAAAAGEDDGMDAAAMDDEPVEEAGSSFSLEEDEPSSGVFMERKTRTRASRAVKRTRGMSGFVEGKKMDVETRETRMAARVLQAERNG
jgi:hypothetical protein